MSIIHDALKKAQQQRKQEKTGVPFSPPGVKTKPRIVLIVIVAVLAVAVIAYLYIPGFHKQKTAVTVQSRAAVPAAKTSTPAKSLPTEQRKPEPQQAQAVPAAMKTEPKTDVKQTAKPMQISESGEQNVRTSNRPKTGGAKRAAVEEPAEEEELIHRTVVKRTEDERIKAQYNEALNLMNAGRSREAQKVFLTIVACRPDHVESLNNLGVICASRGSKTEALGYFKKILGFRTDYPKAYNNIGLIMMSENDPQLAEEYFRKAISLDPNGLEPYMNLCALLRTQGKFKEAEKVLDAPIKKNTRDPFFFLSYAVVKDNLGKTAEAVRYYRQYLSLAKPSDAQRNGVLERLRYLEGSARSPITK